MIFDDLGAYVLGIREEPSLNHNVDAWHPSME